MDQDEQNEDFYDYSVKSLEDLSDFIKIKLREANGTPKIPGAPTKKALLKRAYDEAYGYAIELYKTNPQFILEPPVPTLDCEADLKSLNSWTYEKRINSRSNPLPNKEIEGCQHSVDFRSVFCRGENFTFTANQAAIVKKLWEAWNSGTPDVSLAFLLTELEIESKRIGDIFKSCKNYRKIIQQGKRKGTYHLKLAN